MLNGRPDTREDTHTIFYLAFRDLQMSPPQRKLSRLLSRSTLPFESLSQAQLRVASVSYLQFLFSIPPAAHDKHKIVDTSNKNKRLACR